MSDREAVKAAILGMPNNNLLIELPTGHGKTAVALELLRERVLPGGKVLVVVPKIVLKKNFMAEVKRWWADCPLEFTLITYRSLHKFTGIWDAVVYDEVHHLTPKCREYVKDIHANYSILLSATVPTSLKEALSGLFNNLGCYKRTVKEAIENGVLPDPSVYLLPLELDNTVNSEIIIKNPNCKNVVETDWRHRWNYIGKNYKVIIHCTKRQFMLDLDGNIEWWKKRYFMSKKEAFRNRWLKLCSERLKILSNWRVEHSAAILKYFKNYRTLTFCNSIEQTKILGKYCINSKNKLYQEILNNFNEGRIKHITACNMLDEGVNLANCRIGVYAVLNSSERLIKQKLGRLLRHEHPIIIIPYFIRTREEELVKTMIQDYNPELISIINDIKDIQL